VRQLVSIYYPRTEATKAGGRPASKDLLAVLIFRRSESWPVFASVCFGVAWGARMKSFSVFRTGRVLESEFFYDDHA
jgi:hypothetical protein